MPQPIRESSESQIIGGLVSVSSAPSAGSALLPHPTSTPLVWRGLRWPRSLVIYNEPTELTVLTVGHGGMVGAALVRQLVSEPCEVLTADRATLDLTRRDDTEGWTLDHADASLASGAPFLAIGD